MSKMTKMSKMSVLSFLTFLKSNMLDAADFHNGIIPRKQANNSCFQEIYPWEGRALSESGPIIFLYRNLYFWSTTSPPMHSYLVLIENYCKIVMQVSGHDFFTSQSAIGHFLSVFFSPIFLLFFWPFF